MKLKKKINFTCVILIIISFNFCFKHKYHLSEFDKKIMKPADRDWMLLVNYWKAYIDNPNQQDAVNVINTFPEVPRNGWGDVKRPDEYDYAVETIKNDINKFIPIFKTGQTHAVRLGFKLLNLRDFSKIFPYEVFGIVMKKYPAVFLSEYKIFKKYRHENYIPSGIILSMDIEITGFVEKEINETNDRIKALLTVQDTSLVETRDSLINYLKDEIKYFKDRWDIPTNLEECFEMLKEAMTKDTLEDIKKNNEDHMSAYHFGIEVPGWGVWMRNHWGLWGGNTKLYKFFKDLGIFHADDMSGIILDSFWRHLNNKPIKLMEQVQYYKDFWQYCMKPIQGTFPTESLRYLFDYSCVHPENEYFCCCIHVYKDRKTGEIWLYGLEKGWHKLTKNILQKEEELRRMLEEFEKFVNLK